MPTAPLPLPTPYRVPLPPFNGDRGLTPGAPPPPGMAAQPVPVSAVTRGASSFPCGGRGPPPVRARSVNHLTEAGCPCPCCHAGRPPGALSREMSHLCWLSADGLTQSSRADPELPGWGWGDSRKRQDGDPPSSQACVFVSRKPPLTWSLHVVCQAGRGTSKSHVTWLQPVCQAL